MKKTLVALAALAVTGSAFAMGHSAPASSVTLYGVLDGSVVNVDKVPNGTATGKQNAAYGDSLVRSSVWGVRGSESLGGGMRAVFEAQGDLTSSTGFTNAAGIFRRAANVGLAGGFGEVRLGTHANTMWSTWVAAQVLPANAVFVSVAAPAGFAESFLKQTVTYTSPKVGPAVLGFQYGAGNSPVSGDNGSVYNLSALVTPLAGLELRAAMSNRRSGGLAGGVVATNPVLSASANDTLANEETTVLGVKYTAGPLAVALNHVASETSNATGGGLAIDARVTQIAASYALSKQLTLGGSYSVVDGKRPGQSDSNLFNVQARYSLSPRTSVYGLLNAADNGTGTAISPTFGVAGVSAIANRKQNAVAVGVIHAF